ncbi:MAG: DNA mismatch endonuclease Vsr [Erysipelotrichaceae bacterium]|nr:DNA mismatch endonuclease Vsr [Erysipelotrichaceae bacterium]
MTDIVSKEKRSQNMSAIRSKNTKPEIYLRKLLWKKGLRYRLHDKRIPGNPDLYFPKYKTAVFVNGCFWHRHENCKFAYTPKSNTEFWQQKFDRNIERDKEVSKQLQDAGIHQIVVWECEINSMKKNSDLEKSMVNKLIDEITA